MQLAVGIDALIDKGLRQKGANLIEIRPFVGIDALIDKGLRLVFTGDTFLYVANHTSKKQYYCHFKNAYKRIVDTSTPPAHPPPPASNSCGLPKKREGFVH
jgi:hypothetical protein